MHAMLRRSLLSKCTEHTEVQLLIMRIGSLARTVKRGLHPPPPNVIIMAANRRRARNSKSTMKKYQTSSEMVLFVKKLFRFISHERIVVVSVDLKRIKVKDRSKYAGTRVNWSRK